jgi:hypothetical protein
MKGESIFRRTMAKLANNTGNPKQRRASQKTIFE